MLHEVWRNREGLCTLCLAGPRGDSQRSLQEPNYELVWTFEASSIEEAMTLYHEWMGWGPWKSDFPEEDKKTYAEMGWE